MDGSAQDEKTLAHQAHRRARSLLVAFCETVGLESFVVPRVKQAGDSSSEGLVPSTMGLMLLDIACVVRDLCVVASHLQASIVVPIASGKHISKADLHGYVRHLMVLYQRLLLNLDATLSSGDVVSMEKEGWQVAPSMGQLRDWLCGMSKFREATLEIILDDFVHHLQVDIAKCKATCPTWLACFGKSSGGIDVFHRQRAVDMLKGKMPQVVAAHNKVHATLACMSDVGRDLRVHPKLTDHPNTSSHVAAALTTMAEANTTSVVILGVEALMKYSRDPDGVEQGKQFLAKNRVPANSAIPAIFWHEFENLAAAAGVDDGSKAQPAAIPVKREVDAAPSSSATTAAADQPARASETGAAVKREGAQGCGDSSRVFGLKRRKK